MAKSQNDDLLILISSYPKSNERIIYGITKKGENYFEHGKIYSMNISDPNTRGRFESETFMIKLSDISSTNEYLLSFGKTPQLLEIYDIKNKQIYFNDISTMFCQLYDVKQILGAYLKLTTSDYNYYLIGLLLYLYTITQE